MPYPAFLHEVGKNDWYLNDAYSDAFSVNRREFWTPINILRRYPVAISANYVANDMQVIESRVAEIFSERVTDRILFPESPSNPVKERDVLKIPMIVEGKSYIFGACLNDHTPGSIFHPYQEAN